MFTASFAQKFLANFRKEKKNRTKRIITLTDLAIEGKTKNPTNPTAVVKSTLMITEVVPSKFGISCEYIAAKVANKNAKIRRKTSFVRTKIIPI